MMRYRDPCFVFFFQAEHGIRDTSVTGVQTCALPIWCRQRARLSRSRRATPSRDGRRSACYAACAKAWPVYYAKAGLVAGTGVKRALLATTPRRDGRRQITYAGRPLYYWAGDTKPGRIGCQNATEFGGTWLVVRPSGRLVR